MLPSQTARSSSSRAHMYRRTRSRRLPAIIVALFVLAAGGVIYKWWLGSGEIASAEGQVTPPTAPPVTPKPKPADPAKTAVVPPRDLPRTAFTNPSPTDSTSDKINAGETNPPPSPAASPKPSPSQFQAGAEVAAATTAPGSEMLTSPEPEKGANIGSGNPSASPSTPIAPTVTSLAGQRLQSGLDLLAQNKPVEARATLTAALESANISAADADRIRTELTRLNQRMIFGPEIMSGDPFASSYAIEPGDSLAKLPRKLNLGVDWRFLQRINNIAAPEKLRVGQKIKIVKGPFHATIHKHEFRMDIFMGDAGSAGDRVFVMSMPVGLGEFGATPEGAFTVKSNSKLVDPAWTNPRTGEYFASKDPKNPLGKYWIGLVGTSDNIRGLETYGIHGTIDPDSIGEMRSMGCVRLAADDIALVYELLIEQVSRIEIRGEDYP